MLPAPKSAVNLLATFSPPPPVGSIQRRISNRHFFAEGAQEWGLQGRREIRRPEGNDHPLAQSSSLRKANYL